MITKETVRSYRSAGLHLIPTKHDKSPVSRGGTWMCEFTEAELLSSHGVGVWAGKPSGNLECIDFDNHFGDAKDVLSKFIAEVKGIYDRHCFPIEVTVGGGYHLVYRCEEVGGNKKLACRPMWSEKEKRFKPDAIIETRGEGGFFVVAPTEGYRWVRGGVDAIPTITKEDRKLMFEVAKSMNTWHEIRKETQEDENRPGDLYNNSPEAIEDMKGELERAGWRELSGKRWQRPDKKVGISATLGIVAPNVFYCFTSNGYPFEPMRAYTPFQVVTLLRHKGDFKRFAGELAERYGDRKPRVNEPLKEKSKPRTDEEMESILRGAMIDVSIPVPKPPVIMKIRDFDGGRIMERRLFTQGNYSAITGKSKSKKSSLGAIFLAAATMNGLVDNKIMANLPESMNQVILFDTEQSNYDTYRYSKNVMDIVGRYQDNFITFALREYGYMERCEIIDYVLTKWRDRIGYAFIDGVADLVKSINDEEEANRINTLLMRWTKLGNNHITVNIHQNKNDNFATGWVGTSLLKKAEAIISVTKDPDNARVSKVECTDIRGTAEFKDFDIELMETGLPFIPDLRTISTHYEVEDSPF